MTHGIRTRFARLRRERPTAAMLVAVAALVFAVAGTSVASVATVSALSKQEKKQVSKIATKQIKKQAPGLSVASADTADRATNVYGAQVNADGVMLGSIPDGATSTRLADGIYRVNFPRSVTGCMLFSALGSNDGAVAKGMTGVIPATVEHPNRVGVATYGVTGESVDRDFYVQMTCP
jgi:hypothetical protein